MIAAFQIAFVVAAAVAGFCLIRSGRLKKRCRDSFKETFVKPALAGAFQNLRYEPDKAFDPEFIRDAFDVSGGRTLLEEREFLAHDIAVMTGFMDVMYFKRQAEEVNRSEIAASVAASVELSGTVGTTLRVERGAGMAWRGAWIFWKFLPLLIIAAYLIETVCAVIDHGSELEGGQIGFLLLAGALIAYYALTYGFVRAIAILALYMFLV